MQVEELWPQQQMAIDLEESQHGRAENLQKRRLYLEKANTEIQRNVNLKMQRNLKMHKNTADDHLRRIETLSMQVEELLQQKQIAVEMEELQNVKPESLQQRRLYLGKANFEMKRNLSIQKKRFFIDHSH